MSAQTRQKRRKIYQSDKTAPNIDLTGRDIQILGYLANHRFLDTPLIAKLIPEAGYQGLQRRLRRLFDHGYIDRPPAQVGQIILGNRPMIYALSDKSIKMLKALGWQTNTKRITETNRVTKFNYIDHCLDLARAHISIGTAVTQSDEYIFHDQEALLHAGGLSELKWPTQITFRGEAKKHMLSPDGGFGIEAVGSNAPKYFFLEVDRGTEPIVRSNLRASSIVQKMLAYADTYQNRFLSVPNFRVLFVTTSQTRIQSTQVAFSEHISAPLGIFLFTTLEHVAADPLTKIWQDGKGRDMSLLNSP